MDCAKRLLPRSQLQLRNRTLLLAGLLLPSVSGAQLLPPDFSVPGQVEEVAEVPKETWVDGVPTRFRAAMSRWKPNELFRHYYRVFEDAGFYIPPEKEQLAVSKSLQLTGVDTGASQTHTIILTPMPNGLTSVLMGEADFARYQKPKPQDDGTLLPLGATHVLRSKGEGFWTLMYEVPMSPENIRAHHEKDLIARGYRKAEGGDYVKDSEFIRVSVETGKNGVQRVLLFRSTTPLSLDAKSR
jgi:hypothetical protein